MLLLNHSMANIGLHSSMFIWCIMQEPDNVLDKWEWILSIKMWDPEKFVHSQQSSSITAWAGHDKNGFTLIKAGLSGRLVYE